MDVFVFGRFYIAQFIYFIMKSPTKNQLLIAEKALNFTYPKHFLKLIRKHASEIEKLFPKAEFISNPREISLLQKTFGNDIIPFMRYPQENREEYICFNQNEDYKIVVFAIHAIVMTWKNLEGFFAWIKQNLENEKIL